MPQDVTWSFDPTESDELEAIGELQGAAGKGSYQGIDIDATNGKFSPRVSGDTQINAGTILTFDAAPSPLGATLTLEASGGSIEATCVAGDGAAQAATGSGTASFGIPAEGGRIGVTFTGNTYLKSMALTYEEPYPGDPGEVSALDTVWDLSALDAEADLVQNERGTVGDLKVDARNGGKFAPRDTDTQVNGGTTIYVPVAQSDESATLIVSGNANGQTIKVDGDPVQTGQLVELDTTGAAHYVAVSVEGAGSAYLTSISIDYAADTATYPGTPENVSATDAAWDLTQGGDTIQAARGEFQGIKVDALAGGKFGPRNDEMNHDTQITAGTTLYVPVAADEKGATLRIEGSLSGSLDLEVDGESAALGTDLAIDASETRYVPVTVSANEASTGSSAFYLTSIQVDYASDDVESTHVVTVGPDGDYATINEALAANDSSLKDRLVISIAPDSYHERVVIDKPGVTLQNADETGENPVVIHESYFSGNVWNTAGEYVPQDPVYDLGTDQCATVLVEATATGFTARGITFQNDYNVVDHLGEDEQTPAVAFNSKADKVELAGCRFIGRQDTLYLQGAGNRVFLTGCYVEGTVDFVFGDADAYFHRCDLHMAAFPGRTSGYFTAANTKVGYAGLVFVNCTLTADASLDDVSLGRPWQNLCYYSGTSTDAEGHTLYHGIDTSRPNDTYANVSSAVTFVGCTMPGSLNDTRWDRWTGRDEHGETVSVTYDDTVRFAEYGSRNADGTPSSPSTDETMDFLTFVQDVDLRAEAAQLREQMKIGDPYWVPSHLGFVEDDDFWTGDEPVEPVTPGTGGTTTGNGGGAEDAVAAADTGLARTGDPTSVVGIVACVVVAAAAIGVAVVLRRRSR